MMNWNGITRYTTKLSILVAVLFACNLFAEGEPKKSTLKLDEKGNGDECHAPGVYNTDMGHKVLLAQLVNQMARMI